MTIYAPSMHAQIVWAVTGALVWEAVQRIIEPRPVDGKRELYGYDITSLARCTGVQNCPSLINMCLVLGCSTGVCE